MAGRNVLDFVSDRWCTLRLGTASDQHLAIDQTTGAFASFQETAPAGNKWFHFLILPRNALRNEFWLFSRLAQGGSGELVSEVSGLGLNQWTFEGGDWQEFRIKPLPSYDRDRKVRLTLLADGRAVSTRWNARAFLWDVVEGDDQQSIHIGGAEKLPLPDMPSIEATPGNHDRERLVVEGFNESVVDATEPRVVGTQLIPFPFVRDTYTFGQQMRETPYYLLTRRCLWKKAKEKEYAAAGEKKDTLEWEIGFTQTESTDLELSMSIRVGAKMSYAPAKDAGGIAGEVSFVREEGHKWTRSSQVERYEKIKGSHSVLYEDGQRVRVVVWALVSRYSLTRADGALLHEIEFTEKNEIVRDYHERVPTVASGPEPC